MLSDRPEKGGFFMQKKRGEKVMDMEEIMRMSQEAIGGNQE